MPTVNPNAGAGPPESRPSDPGTTSSPVHPPGPAEAIGLDREHQLTGRDDARTLLGRQRTSDGHVVFTPDAAVVFLELPYVRGALRAAVAFVLPPAASNPQLFDAVLVGARSRSWEKLQAGVEYEDRAGWAFSTWLFRFCRNRAREARKAELKGPEWDRKVLNMAYAGILPPDALAILDERGDDMSSDELWSDAQAAIDRLPGHLRDVILGILAGETGVETAERMRLTPARISQLKKEALQSLRDELLRKGYDLA
jgi:DNA-directed RNA polymerase specialized sigma24 family protein